MKGAKKLKVAIVIPTHFDAQSSLHVLLSAYALLSKKGLVEPTIFTDEKNDAKFPGFKVQKIHSIDYKTPLDKILFVLGIPRFYYTDLVEKLKGYNVVETSNPEFYLFAYQSYLAAKKHSIRLVYRTSQSVDGFFLFHLTKFLTRPFMRKAYDFASALLFTNPDAASRCLRLKYQDSDKKFILLGHGVDTSIFKATPMKKNGVFTILSVGGLYKLKGHHLIIEALKRIVDAGHSDVRLQIVGKGYYEKNLRKLASSLGLEGKVEFLGPMPHEKLAALYNSADAFVLANTQEITPAANEAMACACPVVVMECGGRSFVIPNESYGLVAKKYDVDDIAKKIMFLKEHPAKAKTIARKGQSHVVKNFAMDVYAMRLYKGLSGKSGKGK